MFNLKTKFLQFFKNRNETVPNSRKYLEEFLTSRHHKHKATTNWRIKKSISWEKDDIICGSLQKLEHN
jgi:hypothetical protein